MKYVNMFFIVLMLTACSDQTDTSEPEKQDTDQVNEETGEKVTATFRSIDVKIVKNKLHVSGEAKVTNNEFYYILEQGKKELIPEQKINLEEKEDWGTFKVQTEIKENRKSEDEVPLLTLYGKNSEGKQVNPNFIPIDYILEN